MTRQQIIDWFRSQITTIDVPETVRLELQVKLGILILEGKDQFTREEKLMLLGPKRSEAVR